jgi:hypothetical protein
VGLADWRTQRAGCHGPGVQTADARIGDKPTGFCENRSGSTSHFFKKNGRLRFKILKICKKNRAIKNNCHEKHKNIDFCNVKKYLKKNK